MDTLPHWQPVEVACLRGQRSGLQEPSLNLPGSGIGRHGSLRIPLQRLRIKVPVAQDQTLLQAPTVGAQKAHHPSVVPRENQ